MTTCERCILLIGIHLYIRLSIHHDTIYQFINLPGHPTSNGFNSQISTKSLSTASIEGPAILPPNIYPCLHLTHVWFFLIFSYFDPLWFLWKLLNSFCSISECFCFVWL